MISLYESIFNIGAPSTTRKVVDAARVEDMKKYLFSGSNPIITGIPLYDQNEDGDINKNVCITKDNILEISEPRRGYDGYQLGMLMDDHMKKIFNKNGVVGIKFIPSHINSMLTLCVPVEKDIDFKMSGGPFKIITSPDMFTTVVINPKKYAPGQISCIKNLMLTGDDNLTNINIFDHTFNGCNFGTCRYMRLHMTSDNIRPTILMKNCKADVSEFDLGMRVKDDIFQEWKDYLMDENGPRKDLFKRLGIDNIITGSDVFFWIGITRYSDGERLCIATNIRPDRYTHNIEKCHIPGISKAMYTKI